MQAEAAARERMHFIKLREWGGGGAVTRRLLALNKRGHWHLVAKIICLI